MAKWRPVDVRVWSDRKFLELTEHGRMLWLYLLTSPFMLPIPGVLVSGEMAIAEQLGWSAKGLGEGYGELQSKGLSVVRAGRLVWLRNALEYQPVQGPHHITAISKCWDDVPDCDTKIDIWKALKIACERWPDLFTKALPKALPKPLAIPLRTVSGSGTGTGTGSPPVVPQGGHSDSPQLEAFKVHEDAVTRPADAQAELDAAVPRHPARKGSARRARQELPDDWEPRVQERAKARELGLDVDYEAEQFRDTHRAKGNSFADWDAAFRTWLRNAKKFARRTDSTRDSAMAAQRERILMLEREEQAALEKAGMS